LRRVEDDPEAGEWPGARPRIRHFAPRTRKILRREPGRAKDRTINRTQVHKRNVDKMKMRLLLKAALCAIMTIRQVHGQPACSSLQQKAKQKASVDGGGGCVCATKTKPICGSCYSLDDGGLGAGCFSSCAYCNTRVVATDKACGLAIHSFANLVISGQTIQAYFYSFKYLDGKNVTYSSGGGVCTVSITGKKCSSCTLKKCTGGAFQPTIDCTNVAGTGAKATACTKNTFGGFLSLDTAAEKTTMAGLILPFFGCGKKWVEAVAIPSPTSSSVRSAAPPSASPFSGITEVDANKVFLIEMEELTAELSEDEAILASP
jgi:hypothetical protein